jgi:GNAT superfamily N-acetyltransferase
MSTQLSDPTYTGDLGGGLIRRWSTRADEAGIAHLTSHVFRDGPDDPPNPRSADVARILLNGDFPYMGPGDFAVVEDTSRPGSPIVACTCLWRLRWRYGGIPLDVGQPEMVATDAAYRRRGLARALFEMVEARSRAEGQLVLAVTGIRYFYRKFGYEYALDLEGGRQVPVTAIPEQPEGESGAYSLRLATLDDIPELMRLYDLPSSGSLVWHEATEAFWRHHITSWDAPFVREVGPTGTALYGHLHMILDPGGQVVGYTWLAAKRGGSDLVVFALQLDAGVNWQVAAPCVLRILREYGQQIPTVVKSAKPFSAIFFNLGRSHPIYDVLRETVPMREEQPYAWYVRLPDIPTFLRYIAPVLEARLAASIMPGYTGEVKIDFYRDGLRLQFAEGKLVLAESWQAPLYGNDASAGFPPLVFLQLLFGYRSLDELTAFLPDAWANPEAAVLLNSLFPMYASVVYPLCTV